MKDEHIQDNTNDRSHSNTDNKTTTKQDNTKEERQQQEQQLLRSVARESAQKIPCAREVGRVKPWSCDKVESCVKLCEVIGVPNVHVPFGNTFKDEWTQAFL